jgi:hypothetical protein
MNRKRKYDYQQIQELYDSGFSIKITCKISGMSPARFNALVKQGFLVTRTQSEAAILTGGSGFCSPDYVGSEKHRQSSAKGGGYKERAGRSKGAFRIDGYGVKTWLQSSYETQLADIMTQNDILWCRPKALSYNDGDRDRKYYPDFFLPDYDLYLDTKNDYLAKVDAGKIELVRNQHGIQLFIITQKQITLEYLQSLWSHRTMAQYARLITGKS